MCEFSLHFQHLLLLSLVFSWESDQRARLINIAQALHKLLRIVIYKWNELVTHFYQLASDLVLPFLHYCRVRPVLQDRLHHLLSDLVKVLHILLCLITDCLQTLLLHQTLEANILASLCRVVLSWLKMLGAENLHWRLWASDFQVAAHVLLHCLRSISPTLEVKMFFLSALLKKGCFHGIDHLRAHIIFSFLHMLVAVYPLMFNNIYKSISFT